MRNFNKGKIAWMLLCALCAGWAGAASAAGAYAGKTVLYVNSYHSGYEWSDAIQQGIEQVLNSTGVKLEVAYMDTKHQRDEESKKAAAARVKAYIEELKPDVVIASDDDASKYLIQPYFKDAELPFVFCGVNWDASVYGFPYKNVTGMVESISADYIITELQRYNQGQRLGVLSLNGFSERRWVENFEKVLGQSFTEYAFIDSFEDWKKQYLHLQESVDVLLLLAAKGATGWNTEEAKDFAFKHAKIPSGAIQTWIVEFALLGIVLIPEEQGRWSAQTALRILDGTPPSAIPIVESSETKLTINLKMAEKIGAEIPASLLEYAELLK